MKRLTVIILIVALSAFALTNCVSGTEKKDNIYQEKIRLEQPIEFRPKRFPIGGNPNDHDCIRGDYHHVYKTDTGMHGQEVWLCCVPVDEILSDSFQCGGSHLMLPLYRDPDYFDNVKLT